MDTLHEAPLYLIFHTTYHEILIGLYQGSHCLGTVQELKKDSSKNLLLLTHNLLSAHTVTLRDCSFIGAHSGPGPFTTVRVTIASVNGLAFATQLPLVGVNGLYALLDEFESSRSSQPARHSLPSPEGVDKRRLGVFSQSENVSRDAERNKTTIALLDAYCGDLYYAIQSGDVREMGTCTFDDILKNPLIKNTETTWIGNGVLLNTENIKSLTGAHIPDPLPEICSIESVAQHALKAWHAGETKHQLIPLYIKSHSTIMACTK